MKIFVIEKNYNAHNKDALTTLYRTEREAAPIIYTKTDSALLKSGKPFFIPDWSDDVTYGASLVVRISRLGKYIPVRFAHRYYDAVTVGVSFTARDWLHRLKEAGQPWEMATGFDGAATIGEWVAKEKFRDVQSLPFHVDINGQTAQQGCTNDMLWRIDDTIAYLSQYFTLKTGDMLFTGTLQECSPNINDHFTGYIEDRKVLEFNCK